MDIFSRNPEIKAIADECDEEVRKIKSEYQALADAVYSRCEHKYGDFFTRTGTVIADTNIYGTYYESRVCSKCWHKETRLREDR